MTGGVSGSWVVRAPWSGREVVVKRTTRSEQVVLRLFADLHEPSLPELLASGADEAGPWVVMPYYDGVSVDIMGELPVAAHCCMGRLHARFAGRTTELADDLEAIDSELVRRALTEFGPDQLERARAAIGEALYARASCLLADLAHDVDFCIAVENFSSTLLHGDLYGLNVLQPHGPDGSPMILDWNAARIGPPMFDVAMTSAYDSPGRRAHDQGWAKITGAPPDAGENELAHAWSTALINAMYAGTVAIRSTPQDCDLMITTAEAALQTFRRLRCQ